MLRKPACSFPPPSLSQERARGQRTPHVCALHDPGSSRTLGSWFYLLQGLACGHGRSASACRGDVPGLPSTAPSRLQEPPLPVSAQAEQAAPTGSPTEQVLTCQQRTEKSTRHASAPTAHSYRTAEEVAEARKARRAAAAVRTGWAAAGGLPRGSSGGAPLGKEAGPLPPRSPAGQKQERSEMLCPSGARTSGAPGAAVGRPPVRPRGPLRQLRRVARGRRLPLSSEPCGTSTGTLSKDRSPQTQPPRPTPPSARRPPVPAPRQHPSCAHPHAGTGEHGGGESALYPRDQLLFRAPSRSSLTPRSLDLGAIVSSSMQNSPGEPQVTCRRPRQPAGESEPVPRPPSSAAPRRKGPLTEASRFCKVVGLTPAAHVPRTSQADTALTPPRSPVTLCCVSRDTKPFPQGTPGKFSIKLQVLRFQPRAAL